MEPVAEHGDVGMRADDRKSIDGVECVRLPETVEMKGYGGARWT